MPPPPQRPLPPPPPPAGLSALPLEARCRARLEGFLRYAESLRLEQHEVIARDNADAITLCSMHASKGLEWPVVFAARMNEGECPLAVQSDAGLQEERRLAYVAMSRAKSLLHLTHVAVEPGGAEALPSRFLRELPPHLLEHRSAYY